MNDTERRGCAYRDRDLLVVLIKFFTSCARYDIHDPLLAIARLHDYQNTLEEPAKPLEVVGRRAETV